MIKWHPLMPHQLLDACAASGEAAWDVNVQPWDRSHCVRIALAEDHQVFVLIGSEVSQHGVMKGVLAGYALAVAAEAPADTDAAICLNHGATVVAESLQQHGVGLVRFWQGAFEEAKLALFRHLTGQAGYVDYMYGPASAMPKAQPVFVTDVPAEFREALARSERRPWTRGKAGDA